MSKEKGEIIMAKARTKIRERANKREKLSSTILKKYPTIYSDVPQNKFKMTAYELYLCLDGIMNHLNNNDYLFDQLSECFMLEKGSTSEKRNSRISVPKFVNEKETEKLLNDLYADGSRENYSIALPYPRFMLLFDGMCSAFDTAKYMEERTAQEYDKLLCKTQDYMKETYPREVIEIDYERWKKVKGLVLANRKATQKGEVSNELLNPIATLSLNEEEKETAKEFMQAYIKMRKRIVDWFGEEEKLRRELAEIEETEKFLNDMTYMPMLVAIQLYDFKRAALEVSLFGRANFFWEFDENPLFVAIENKISEIEKNRKQFNVINPAIMYMAIGVMFGNGEPICGRDVKKYSEKYNPETRRMNQEIEELLKNMNG